MQLIRSGSLAVTRAPGTRPARRVAAAVVLMLGLAGCSSGGGPEAIPDEDHPMTSIEDVLAAHTPELMKIDGVEGTGIGLCDETPCIRVYLRSQDVAARVPKTLDGHTVSTVVTGTVRPLTTGA